MTKKLLVIGLGNTLSGDDGFGPLVVARLCREYPGDLGCCDLVDAHTDILAHFDSFQHYEDVLLVDALLDPQHALAAAGSVIVLDEAGMESLPESATGAHAVSPLLAVKLYRKLYGECRPKFSLLSLCTDQIEIGRATRLNDASLNAGCQMLRKLLASGRQRGISNSRPSHSAPDSQGQ